MKIETEGGMKLDPQARALLAELDQREPDRTVPGFLADTRQLYERSRIQLSGAVPAVAGCQDLQIPGSAGAVRARCYRPQGSAPGQLLPVIVFFHGGGWVYGGLDSHDTVCRHLANASDAAVIAVDYRLAPENPFPAAVEDALAAVRWVRRTGGELSLDSARLVLAGDSAGGNLVAVTTLQMRDADDAPAAMQVLIYPAVDFAMESPSHHALAEGYALTRFSMLWLRSLYLRQETEIADWRASPLRAASFAGLPPAYVITAGFDPLRDEGQAYAAALEAAGVGVSSECFEGMIHGFLLMGGRVAAAGHAIYRIAQQLRPVFRGMG
jgi:acetyl esterase